MLSAEKAVTMTRARDRPIRPIRGEPRDWRAAEEGHAPGFAAAALRGALVSAGAARRPREPRPAARAFVARRAIRGPRTWLEQSDQQAQDRSRRRGRAAALHRDPPATGLSIHRAGDD